MRNRSSLRLLGVAIIALAAACGCSQRSSRAELLRQGSDLMERQRYSEAASVYQRALSGSPGDAEIQAKLAKAYASGGDMVRASDLLPDDADLQLAAATKMLLEWRFADVEHRMAALLAREPRNTTAMLYGASAIARMSNPRWVLLQLSEVVSEPARFDARRLELRPQVGSSDDARAEALFRKALAQAPLNKDVLLHLSGFLWLTGRIEDAERFLRMAVEQSPTDDVPSYALASYYMRVNRREAALPFLERAASNTSGESSGLAGLALVDYRLASNPSADERPLLMSMLEREDALGEVSVRLAQLDYRDGKPADAVHRLNALLARVPNKPAALLLKARIINGMGNPDPRYARAAAAADPMSSQAKMFLGQLLASNGDLNGALEQYVEAVKLAPDSVEANLTLARTQLALRRPADAAVHARDALRLNPDSKEAALLLVTALTGEGEFAAADEALAKLFPRVDDDADIAVQAGVIAQARGNSTAARAHFLRALDRAPDSMAALAELVKLESKARISSETQVRVQAAVMAHPNDPVALFLAAQVAEATGNRAAAHESLVAAFALDSGNDAVAQALARSWEGQGRVDDAISVLRQVVNRGSASTEIRTRLATLLEQSGRSADATKLYEQIVGDDPDAATASYRLAGIYLADPDKLSRAQELAISAKRVRPEDPAVNDVLGRIYTAKGLTSMAIPPLRQAIAAEPDNAAYHLHLGIALEEAGNLGSAREEYVRALEIDPSVSGAERARRFTSRR